MPHIKFTLRSLDQLKPEAKEVIYHDITCPGLGLRLSPKGKRTFFAMISQKRRKLETQLLETARRMTRELQNNPADRSSTDFTLLAIFDLWMKNKAKPHKRTWERDQSRFTQYLEPWSKRKISKIQKVEVTELHNKIHETNGPYAANDTIAFLSSLYSYAENFDFEGRNPCRHIERFPEQERERFLTPEEFPRWYKAVQELRVSVSRDFFMLCIWTGVRRECVLGMRWDQVDLAAKIWTIPREADKGKRDLLVYLSDEALSVLEIRKRTSKSDWVLPSPNGSSSGHYADPKSAWKSVLSRSGISNLRIHDLRRTLGSWMAENNTSLAIIGKTLGHKSLQATRIYARLGGGSVRNAVNAATAAMRSTLESDETEK